MDCSTLINCCFMKRKYFGLTAMLLLTLMFSCKKDRLQVIDEPLDLSPVAQVKYYNFAVSGPAVNFFANNTKVGALSSATGSESTTGVTYGSVVPSSSYSIITPGTYTFKSQLSGTNADPNRVISSVQATVEAGKAYTLFTAGTYNATAKTTEAFVLEDKIPAVDYTTAYVRFVNTTPNGTGAQNLYAKNTVTGAEVPIAVSTNGIAYKGASEFVKVPIGIYELITRYAATPTTNLIIRNGTTNGTVAFVGGRVYTIASRGDITLSQTGTSTNRPLLDNTPNR
jgi:hypothetical protein